MKTNIISLICFLLLFPSCAYPVRYDGPYKGRIVDAETGAPIEGVVVLGVWYKETPTVAGAVGSYYDAQETVSDKNGDFEIRGLGLKVFSFVAPMNVLVFKAGYSQIGLAQWESHKYEGGLMRDKAKVEDDRVILPLRKLPMEKRKARLFGKEDIPDEKQKLLIRELNKENKALGLQLYEEMK
jgi:hypothetical protein